jgi:Fe2+ or Zn2+ uptake regulation protein
MKLLDTETTTNEAPRAFAAREHAGLKLTAHREAVLDEVNKAANPFTVDQLFDHLQKVKPEISRPTIYRCLGLMLSSGVLQSLALPNRRMVCFRPQGGAVGLIECAECGIFRLSDVRAMAPVFERMAGDHAMALADATVHVRGRCRAPGCQAGRDPWTA